MGPPPDIRKKTDTVWEIPSPHKAGMLVPARIIGTENPLRAMDDGVFEQVSNAAMLPGIVRYSFCMPDGHRGCGFPIGGMAAMDPDRGVISPGGIGFDVNCGMRPVRTELTLEEVKPKLRELIDKLFERVPAGVGSQGFVPVSEDGFRRVLEQGARWCDSVPSATSRGDRIVSADWRPGCDASAARCSGQLAQEKVMGRNVAQKLIEAHLLSGKMNPGEEIGLKIDQTLTQDATGTMVMLEFEAMGLPRVRTEVSAQYVDHNLLQTDFKNADDHLFLYSACMKFGVWYSRPGNGVSHPVHMERFGIPGKSLLGSDSHTCGAGALGMLAIGAGGLEVALAMAGEPFYVRMPRIWGVRLTGSLPDWVSAKDVVLEMLRRHGVDGGMGKIIEYHGPGLERLSTMDRHVIANMGAELGATTTIFPSDRAVWRFLKAQGREGDWVEILADPGAGYDETEEIHLSDLEPLIACPSSPGNVVPVREVAGREIHQAMVGSSANPGLRDFAISALIVEGKQVHPRLSFDVNPTSRQILENLISMGYLAKLVRAGARVHQPGCNGCIGMGQAPGTGKISLRTVPRNFPGRSGTENDQVYLCSPETASASALTGRITDPRALGVRYHRFEEPAEILINTTMLLPPVENGGAVELEKGPNIRPLPGLDPLPEALEGPVLLKVGDDISTDEIMPAGTRVLPFRSNIPEISRFVFEQKDASFYRRAMEHGRGVSFVVGGKNYGQGSSREHAALAPRYLGVRAVIAKGFARIHFQNLVNFGILPLEFADPEDYDRVNQGDILAIGGIPESLRPGEGMEITNKTRNERYLARHSLGPRQIELLRKGGLVNMARARCSTAEPDRSPGTSHG